MSKKSKDLISDTLIHLMKDYPFDVITITEICGHISLVRKTFYNNFSSKQDVIAYIVKKLVAEYLEMVREESSYSLKEMSYLYFCFGKKNEEILSLLIDNNLFHIFRNKFNDLLPSINTLVPGNKLKELDDGDLEYFFAFHSAGVTHLLEIWIKTEFQKSARQMSDIYYAISLGIIENGS